MASVADFGSTEANDLTHERRGPSPWVAGLLTVLAPGLGHIYIGEARRGITLFILVGLLSIYPTMKFASWRKALAANEVPVLDPAAQRKIKMVIHTELTLVVLILFCAALMARGIGTFS